MSSHLSLQLRETTTSDGVVVLTESGKPNTATKRSSNAYLRSKNHIFGKTRQKVVRFFSCFGAVESVMESWSPEKTEERIAPNVFCMDTLTDRQSVFYDRIEAGKILARWLPQVWKDAGLPGTRTNAKNIPSTSSPTSQSDQLSAVVYGIPSGGIPVAATIATELQLPLRVAVVSKILLPWNTEVGCGAVSFRGTVKWNEPFLHSMGLSKERLQKQVEEATAKVNRRTTAFGGAPTLSPQEERGTEVVVLVDDGLASGWTMTLAVEEFRKMGAKHIVIVVPTGSYDVVLRMAKVADYVFCANIRRGPSFAVAAAYENWYDEEEEQVIELVRSFHHSYPPHKVQQ
jgi:putative phosphoribosyl transferase